jgi:DNA-binding transcriptional ArsR family regulator
MADKGKSSGRSRKRKKPGDTQRHRLEMGHERAKLSWAIAHPVRRRVLRTLADSGETHSSTWLAHTLDLPIGTTAYHVTILRKFGAVELAQPEETSETDGEETEGSKA